MTGLQQQQHVIVLSRIAAMSVSEPRRCLTQLYPFNGVENQKMLNKYLKQANKIEKFYLAGR